MARLIDADELGRFAFHIKQSDGHERCVVDWDDIENAPTVDAQPVVHGRWVRNLENCLYNKCSVCGFWHCREDNYCTNCGAKMGLEVVTDE